MVEEVSYWVVEYISCESNERWTIVRAPIDWGSCDVRDRVPMGGCGDDVAEIREVYETSDKNYSWDFCD